MQGSKLRAQVAVVSKGRDGAVDIELGVGTGVAAVGDGEADQVVSRGMERLRPGPAQLAALGKGELAERGTALGARVLERLAEVDPRGSRPRERLLGGGIDQDREATLAFEPAILDVAAQGVHGRARYHS